MTVDLLCLIQSDVFNPVLASWMPIQCKHLAMGNPSVWLCFNALATAIVSKDMFNIQRKAKSQQWSGIGPRGSHPGLSCQCSTTCLHNFVIHTAWWSGGWKPGILGSITADFLFYFVLSKVTAPQDAHGRLVLQVYLGSITSEFMLYIGKIFVSRL